MINIPHFTSTETVNPNGSPHSAVQSKGLSRVFSNTTVQKHQFFGAQGVSGPSSSRVWIPRVFADDARGWQCPFVLCLHPQGCLRRGVRVGSSSTRDQISVPCIARHILNHWTTKEAHICPFEVRQVDSFSSILLSQDCFGYLRFFVFPYKL